jgi:transcription elongation factor Elf1
MNYYLFYYHIRVLKTKMFNCSTCNEEHENIHIVFVDKYFRTYKLLCEKCFQNFATEWRKNSNSPVPEYVYPQN